MILTRRRVAGGITMIGLAGCSSREATPADSFDVTDVTPVNRRSAPVTVVVQARDIERDQTVLDRAVELAANGTRNLEDPFTNDRAYAITVSADELDAEFEWTEGFRDDSGVHVEIRDDRIEFEPVVA